MGVEYVDTYYIHWPRHGIDLAAAVEELARQRERGLLRRIGLCNVTRQEVETAHRAARVDTVQFGYNLIWRRPETQQLTTLPQDRVAYSVLAQGLLARPFPYEPLWDAADHRRATPLFQEPLWSAVYTFQQEFVRLCREARFVPAAVAVLWALNRVDATLAGARSIEQLDRLIDGLTDAYTRPGDLEQLSLRVTDSSSKLQKVLPQLPNMFGYVPTPCRSC
jgi:aryl-alcohol dehydrogenase-like predicted oxidoreductase